MGRKPIMTLSTSSRRTILTSLSEATQTKNHSSNSCQPFPPRKGSVRPKYHRTTTVLSISSKEIKQLISTLRSDGSWQDINYDDTKRSGWEPKIHAEQILKLTKYYYREQQKFQPSEKTRLTDAIHQTMNFWFTKDWCARTDGTTQ